MSQLRELARPLPQQFIGKSDRGMDAADHTVITQRMLQVVGPHSFTLVEVLRSVVDGVTTKSGKAYPGGLYVTGVVARLTVEVDGRTVSVDEAGGCEQAALKDGDGERLKHAMSDAYKRCAMRLGLGLHIWAQEMYFLDRQLDKDAAERAVAAAPAPSDTGGTVTPDRDDVPITAAQVKALNIGLRLLIDPDNRMDKETFDAARFDWIAQQLDGLLIDSTKSLSRGQASVLLDRLPKRDREAAA